MTDLADYGEGDEGLTLGIGHVEPPTGMWSRWVPDVHGRAARHGIAGQDEVGARSPRRAALASAIAFSLPKATDLGR